MGRVSPPFPLPAAGIAEVVCAGRVVSCWRVFLGFPLDPSFHFTEINMLQRITTALAIAAVVIIAIFAIQNLGAVEVTFLVWSASVSKIVIILGTYVLGMLTGGGLLHLIKGSLKRSKAS